MYWNICLNHIHTRKLTCEIVNMDEKHLFGKFFYKMKALRRELFLRVIATYASTLSQVQFVQIRIGYLDYLVIQLPMLHRPFYNMIQNVITSLPAGTISWFKATTRISTVKKTKSLFNNTQALINLCKYSIVLIPCPHHYLTPCMATWRRYTLQSAAATGLILGNIITSSCMLLVLFKQLPGEKNSTVKRNFFHFFR